MGAELTFELGANNTASINGEVVTLDEMIETVDALVEQTEEPTVTETETVEEPKEMKVYQLIEQDRLLNNNMRETTLLYTNLDKALEHARERFDKMVKHKSRWSPELHSIYVVDLKEGKGDCEGMLVQDSTYLHYYNHYDRDEYWCYEDERLVHKYDAGGNEITLNCIYQVVHTYDVDGGFGDAITREDVVATFSKWEDAKAYRDKWNNPHVYAKPYSCLECGLLHIECVDIDSTDIDYNPFKCNSEWEDVIENESEQED